MVCKKFCKYLTEAKKHRSVPRKAWLLQSGVFNNVHVIKPNVLHATSEVGTGPHWLAGLQEIIDSIRLLGPKAYWWRLPFLKAALDIFWRWTNSTHVQTHALTYALHTYMCADPFNIVEPSPLHLNFYPSPFHLKLVQNDRVRRKFGPPPLEAEKWLFWHFFRNFGLKMGNFCTFLPKKAFGKAFLEVGLKVSRGENNVWKGPKLKYNR